MALISLDSVSKTLGETSLFTNVSFSIEAEEHIGFVGPNGAGKSTLLKILAGILEADQGTITRKRGLHISTLDQVPRWERGDRIRDFLFRSTDPLVQLVDRYERVLQDPASSPETISALNHEMEERGGYNVEHRFSSLLSELDIQDLNVPMETLSGGMVKKVALVRCLASDTDLLLLDEPTNHLDIDTIEWLEKKLIQSGKAFVLVTHDRWFLDTVCNVIIDIDRRGVAKYPGDYSEYLERLEERAQISAGRERRREAILRVELEWLKRGPKARGGKDKKRKERIRELVQGRPEAPEAKPDAFRTSQRRLGGKVLELHQVSKSYEGKPVLKNFSYTLSVGERIGIIGPNGSGKSTLLNLIAGTIEPDSGTVVRGETVAIGYFDQTGAAMNANSSILEYVQSAAERISFDDGTELTAEQFLERFGYPRSMQSQKIEKLSGGERRRLQLVRLLIASPNVLLFDEPTNDIDIGTIALLEDFLRHFQGSVIVVSHDRSFLEGMTDSLWIFDGKGNIQSYVGTYSAWREQQELLQEQIEQERGPKSALVPQDKLQREPIKGQKQKLSFKEKRELEQLLPEISALEEEKTALEAAFSHPESPLARDGKALAEAHRRYETVLHLIDEKTLRWEELAARSDT
ncbi:ABC-F family ATP-binding cassette domain-containing protein [Gracilinema caldarium]|uniref:ABC transporter related protein n=1 Tax=Gracilinema caldarium (strain ATCC 51460 / DSM 7334 / H1) TaxID=744872 RepID=F8EZM8_GRAC1|nr:ABC-F family ATP-binding cassette domain-containing protein [Gracilinema caldarium]AEJ20752.1 ABC transporter related protein [Gracilinema caldarium DSM 7334]